MKKILVTQCSLLYEGCIENMIRLVDGYTENDSAGRVEVCVDGRWGTLQTNQTQKFAEISCRLHTKELVSFSSCLGEKRQLISPHPTESWLQHTGTQYGYRQSKPVHHCDGNTLTCSEGGTDDHSADLGVVCGSPLDEGKCITYKT